jgi:6-pyruvoyltetrahydropterin/6-carboxytetrahydropterin synthase
MSPALWGKDREIMYHVTRQIDFCYGHRLTNYAGKCCNLHGHNGRVEIEVGGGRLDDRGMLTDFADIKRIMKEWIDENLDHRMILQADDPAAGFIRSQGEPLYEIQENPTAEAIAKLIFLKARERGLPVSRVRMWETADSCATYEEEG